VASERKFEICDRCGHEIVEGIACDFQPEDCPFLKEDRQEASSELAQASPRQTEDRPDLHFVVGED